MDIILAFIKFLTVSLTAPEILVVIVSLATLGILISFFILKKKDIVKSYFADTETDTLREALVNHIGESISSIQMADEIERLERKIAESINSLKEKFVEISSLRSEIADQEFERILGAIEELRRIQLSYTETTTEYRAVLLASVYKTGDVQARMLSQIEKIDEGVRAAIPEFRTAHKDLASEIKMLSRDIALVERSIQLQMNNTNTIKLR